MTADSLATRAVRTSGAGVGEKPLAAMRQVVMPVSTPCSTRIPMPFSAFPSGSGLILASPCQARQRRLWCVGSLQVKWITLCARLEELDNVFQQVAGALLFDQNVV